MRSHRQIIQDAGGVIALAEKLGISDKQATVRSWWKRNSINADYWLAISKLDIATTGELAASRPQRRPNYRAA